PETLDFVQECSERWGVRIVWLERGSVGEFRRVSHNSVSRNGEPFTELMRAKEYLPNPVTRFCTIELKIRPARDYARSFGWEHWTVAVGLRADEPGRVAKIKDNRERWENVAPMALAGVTKRHVTAFWSEQPFDLRLPNVNGTTPAGNCDLCFLKGGA